MSKYIDVGWLKQNFNTVFWSQITKTIDSAPSIDIVRCRECKYWKSTVQMPNGTEVKCLYGRKADDFCSCGCKKGADDE